MANQARAFAAGAALGVILAASVAAIGQTGGSLIDKTTGPAPRPPLPVAELRRIADAYGAVKANYAEEPNDRLMVDGCIGGMLRKLDPQSEYLDSSAFRDLMIATRGARGGVGLEAMLQGDRVRVIAPLEGTPAERGGIVPGDYIIKVDDTETSGLSLSETFKLLTGPVDSTVRLTLVRAGLAEPLVLTMRREVIKVTEVRSKLAAPGVGYVRVSQFRESTPESLARALNALRAENGSPLRGLVLDLRNNPGGLLNSSIAVAAAFLDEDKVVASMKGRNEDANRQYTAHPRDYERGTTALGTRAKLRAETRSLSVVVLVNRASAAGSEIVAGALQDYARATLVGEKTFGRGSIQTIMPMGDSTAIKLTTAYWQTPKGRPIHGSGIAPDVVLDAQAAKPAPAFEYGGASDAGLQRALEILKR